MHATLKVDGKITSLETFVCPEMNLSSARSEMVKNEFTLIVNAAELIKEMNSEYEDWAAESRDDDQMCGGPQDELAEAGYPPIDELVKMPDLLELTFGHYLIRELFDRLLPSKYSKMVFWFDEITECEVNNTDIVFKGICYSRSKT